MPAKSKQQQKFFGVVKAMQKGDIPKKGEAGDVADDMSKKDVDKYAGTKHKGLPKKVKKEMISKDKYDKLLDGAAARYEELEAQFTKFIKDEYDSDFDIRYDN